MGLGNKDKRKRSRSSSSCSSSSSPDISTDEAKSKKHPTLGGGGGGDEGATKRREKKKKKDKSRMRDHQRSHNKSSKRPHTSREKKSGDKHSLTSYKHGPHPKFKVQELSLDDYFSKNNEFATWLKEVKSLFFSDLSSESARDLFSEFVSQWNDSKLDPQYYEGIATGPRTSHKWNIRK